MLKTFDVAELRPGMHVQRLLGPWMQHPFWRTSFVLDEARLAQLQDSGVQQVVVDLARSQLDDESLVDGVPPEAPAWPQEVDAAAAAEGERRRVVVPDGRPDFAAELARARRICGDARDAVEAMFREARLGRGVDAGQAMPLIDEITGSVDRHPTALVSVARLKTADDYTYLHSMAVAGLMTALARQLGLSEDEVHAAARGGLLHDMGKAVTPPDVLNKPGSLTEDEYSAIRRHPEEGHRLLIESGVDDAATLDIALHHHEKMDGTGYPHRLSGEQISRMARMAAVCDVYDAITSNRPYKRGWCPAESLKRMASWTGHFDPVIFQAFVKSLGIYPVGTLVRLQSQQLGVVIEQSPAALLKPKVRVFHCLRRQSRVLMYDLDLAAGDCSDRVLQLEAPGDWGIRDLEKLWMP